MADDIKTDADKQRAKEAKAKPGPSQEEASADEQTKILGGIKDSLIQASPDLGEGSSSAHLEQISKDVLRIADLQQIQYENNLEKLEVEKDKLEGESARSLDDSEERREMLNIFKEIRDTLVSATAGGAVGKTGAATKEKGGGLFGGLFGGDGDGIGSKLGLGYAAKGIGAGVATAALGIGALLLALAGADAIAHKFGNEGKTLKNVLINLGKGLEGMGTTGLVALGSLFAMSSFLAMFPGHKGVKAGLGIAAIGAGIGGFFFSLGVMEKGLDWMDTDFSSLPPVMKNFSDSIGELDAGALTALGTLFGSAAILAMFPGHKGVKAGLGIAAIGAGIAGFFGGLGLLDASLSWMDIDGSSLPAMFGNVADSFEAFTSKPDALKAMAGLLVAGGIFGATGMSGKAAVGMGAIGVGLGAFFGGLGAGDWALGAMGSDGGNLKAIMVNIAEGLEAFTGPQLAGLLAVGGIFAAVSAVPGGTGVAVAASLGLGIAGLGIGAFIAGMAIGGKVADLVGADGSSLKKILTNMAVGLTAFNTVNAGNLAKTAAGMAVLAPAMILLTTGQVISKAGEFIGNALDWAGSWFGGDDDGTDQLGKMAESLMQFEKLKNLEPAAVGVEKLTKSVVQWGLMDHTKITENAIAAAASFEMMEKALIGGMPTLLNAEIPITFKGILNVEGMKETADEINLLFNSMIAVPNTGMVLQSAGNVGTGQGMIINNDMSTVAPTNQSINTSNTAIQNMNPQDSATFNTLRIKTGGG